MELTVNGKILTMSEVETLQELLNKLKIDSGRVIVEINLSIVRKSEYSMFKLHEGDKIEIVNFVGGG